VIPASLPSDARSGAQQVLLFFDALVQDMGTGCESATRFRPAPYQPPDSRFPEGEYPVTALPLCEDA
jgi:hypothetical protein